MKRTTLSENYSICLGDDGSPRELERRGAVATYKAIGYESGKPVALKLIPLAGMDEAVRAEFEKQARQVQKVEHLNVPRIFDVGVENEHLVLASEYLQGETAEAWLVNHGPMPADAVVRMAMQVVSALGAANFHGLAHRAIQPSNLLIVNGVANDGGWPLVKLTNFGLAGFKLYSEEDELREFAPSIAPQFASPEQLEGHPIDFRSEIFSLGATMCFLLTGAVPLLAPVRGDEQAERALPAGVSIPRPVRLLLLGMLRNDPAERPQDPVTFGDELRRCLRKVERRTAFSRRFGVPPALALPSPADRPKRRVAPVTLALAALLLAVGVVAAIMLPEKLRAFTRGNRDLNSIGVPIGVPENQGTVAKASPVTADGASKVTAASQVATSQETSGAAKRTEVTARPPVAQTAPQPSAPVTQQPTNYAVAQNSPVQNVVAPSFPSPSATMATMQQPQNSPAMQIASNYHPAEPVPPGEGPPLESPVQPPAEVAPEDRQHDTVPANSSERDISQGKVADASQAKPKPAARDLPERRLKSKSHTAVVNSRGVRTTRDLPPLRVGSVQARFVKANHDGSWVLQLPSGKAVITPPVPEMDDAPVIHARVVRRVNEIPPDNRPPVVVLPPGE